RSGAPAAVPGVASAPAPGSDDDVLCRAGSRLLPRVHPAGLGLARSRARSAGAPLRVPPQLVLRAPPARSRSGALLPSVLIRMREPSSPDKDQASDFEAQASRATPGLIRESIGFLRQSRKWWLFPVLLALVALGIFVVLAETAVAPFIYTLF